MIRREQGERALQYICGLLQHSGRYEIQESTLRYAVVRRDPLRDSTRDFAVLLANSYRTVSDFREAVTAMQLQHYVVAPILYKDGENAFVQLLDPGRTRRGGTRSLRRYQGQELASMLSLRDMERAVIKLVGHQVQYYQPPTERLEESLRDFELRYAEQRYGHLEPGDKGFGKAKDGISVTRKIPIDRGRVYPAADFIAYANGTAQVVSAVAKATRTHQELLATAQAAFPALDGEDAYRALQGEPL